MSYLIRVQGVADELFWRPGASVDRPSLLPEFESVTIEGKSTNWGKLPPGGSLRGLTTVQLVLLAGYASERIKRNIHDNRLLKRSWLVRYTFHLAGCYVEEMTGETLSFSEMRKATREVVEEHLKFVDGVLHTYWSVIEALANALLQHKTLSESEAFGIIEQVISEIEKPVAGSIIWKDLTVENAEDIQKFYCEVVGWKSVPHDMGEYHDFDIIVPSNSEIVTGICYARGDNAKLPPQWLIYIAVENVDESVNRCVELGGQIVDGPRAVGDSRFCVIQDPAGAVVALIS